MCETENHIGYINLTPKKEYLNARGYAEIDAELFRITGNRLAYILLIEESGMTEYLYKRPPDLPVNSDAGWNTTLVVYANNCRALYLFVNKARSANETHEMLGGFIKRYFTDVSGRPLSINGAETEGGEDVGRKLLKKQHHKRYSSAHTAAISSPIEKLLREELIKQGVEFREQVEFNLDCKKFSVPDFVIDGKLMVYCDGTEFHKDPQRIIMDKQQDRTLQAQGFNVFRFSGSEIVADASKCVNEIRVFMKRFKK